MSGVLESKANHSRGSWWRKVKNHWFRSFCHFQQTFELLNICS